MSISTTNSGAVARGTACHICGSGRVPAKQQFTCGSCGNMAHAECSLRTTDSIKALALMPKDFPASLYCTICAPTFTGKPVYSTVYLSEIVTKLRASETKCKGLELKVAQPQSTPSKAPIEANKALEEANLKITDDAVKIENLQHQIIILSDELKLLEQKVKAKPPVNDNDPQTNDERLIAIERQLKTVLSTMNSYVAVVNRKMLAPKSAAKPKPKPKTTTFASVLKGTRNVPKKVSTPSVKSAPQARPPATATKKAELVKKSTFATIVAKTKVAQQHRRIITKIPAATAMEFTQLKTDRTFKITKVQHLTDDSFCISTRVLLQTSSTPCSMPNTTLSPPQLNRNLFSHSS